MDTVEELFLNLRSALALIDSNLDGHFATDDRDDTWELEQVHRRIKSLLENLR